ncbi:HU family DNA-binding protein [candidate division KSB1 bacterium]|nr:HU family DNA-binding protein [candidate division KSB1 bacterium]MCH8285042.1 HU family DNA-binding protein [candidate division KSB1 bacterium]
METVVKKDIVRIVAKNTSMNKDKVAIIVDGVFKTLTEYLKEANPEVRIEIRGFGVLGIKKAKAKPKARNPRTNEIIYVPPHRKTFFKPGRILNQSLQNSL